MESPIVSICCITYNHAPFIRKALDGFLMQEPPTGVPKDELWYEILIHDDCSTDGTTEIIKEYVAKYPDRIFPLYEKENQYSKGHVADIDQYNYKRAKGKYIAYCEGDDYWTDAKKLQKQVDFMESHPEYSITWTICDVYDCEQDQQTPDISSKLFANNEEKIDVTLDMYFDNWITQPLTMVFRSNKYSFAWHTMYAHYKDMHEMYHLLKEGKGCVLNFNSGVYNRHNSGVFGKVDLEESCKTVLAVAEELYTINRDSSTLKFYERALRWNIANASKTHTNKASLSWQLFALNKNVKLLLKNLIR